MKNIKDFILENINESNKLSMSLGSVDINIDELSINDTNLLKCSDDEFEDAINSDGTYYIKFNIPEYGKFDAEVEIDYDDINVNLRNSDFKRGDYIFWKNALEKVFGAYLGDFDMFGWTEDLLNELKSEFN